MTQAELARLAGLTRTTVNQVEAGVCRDLGTRKVIRLLQAVGLKLEIEAVTGGSGKDFLRMACVTANVGFKRSMTPDELAHAMLTGKVDRELRPHLRAVFDEAPGQVVQGLVEQVASMSTRPEKVYENMKALAKR